MGRPSRILFVTLALAAAGGTFGAVAAALGLALAMLLTTGFLGVHDLPIIGAGARIGGVLGIVLGPAGAWLLLRRVPLGTAVAWTAFGAFAGGIVGWILGWIFESQLHELIPSLGEALGLALVGALVGFVIAALLLRRRVPQTPSMPVASAEPPQN